ncbi:MAG TPA: hypothetical protein VFV08_09140, partial [Puia sp.]|nr:hypothetical protein [Puia sp.]
MFRKIPFFVSFLCLSVFLSCKKDNNSSHQITGLWEGTYTCCSQPALYFSFTIYPDGTLSYKSKGINNATFYASGTWILNGNAFTYDVLTLNTPGGPSHQVGSATYSSNGTLTNG